MHEKILGAFGGSVPMLANVLLLEFTQEATVHDTFRLSCFNFGLQKTLTFSKISFSDRNNIKSKLPVLLQVASMGGIPRNLSH